MNFMTSINLNLQPTILIAQTGGIQSQNAIIKAVMGMGIVLFAFLLIMVIFMVLKKIRQSSAEPEESNQPQVAPQESTPAPQQEPGITPELIAILTAAAFAALGTNVRIRKIRFTDTHSNTAWADTGRRLIHTSHRLRKKDS